jgi:hypothetical protein
MVAKYKPILSLDFDGTVNSYRSGWKGPRNLPDPAMPGALQFITEAQEFFTVHIFSTRSHYFGGRRTMKSWLTREYNKLYDEDGESGLPEWFMKRINWATLDPFHIVFKDTVKDIVSDIKFPRHKPPALVAIDDRAIQFQGIWPSPEELLKFKPYKPS